jgi:hypothetical protein
MRLPGIEYNKGVQSLGRYDIHQPMQTAQMEGAAIGAVVDSAQDTLHKWQQRQDEIDLRNITLEFTTQKSDWAKKNFAKSSYLPNELPDDLPIEKTEKVVDDVGNQISQTRTSIPAYEVQPELYRRTLTALIDTFGERFHNKELASKWTAKMSEAAEESIAQVTLNSAKKQKEYSIDKTLGDTDRALEAQQYDLAKELLKANLDLDPEKRREYLSKVAVKQETDGYDTLLTNQHRGGLTAALLYLTKTESYDGALSKGQARQYASAIRSTLASMDATLAHARAQQEKHLKHQARMAIEVLNRGKQFNPTEMANLQSKIEAVDPELATDLSIASTYADMFRRIAFTDSANRQRVLKESEANALSISPGSLESTKLMMMLRDGSDRIDAEINRDQVKFFAEISGKRINDIDFSSPEALSESVQKRLELGSTVADMWKVPEKYLTTAEADDLAEKVRSSDKVAQLEYARSFHKALGEKAYKLYDQLQIKEVGAFTTAGRAVVEGDANAAKLILEGEQLRKENPALLATLKSDLDERILERISPAYIGNSTQLAEMHNAILNVYAKLSAGGKNDAVDDDTVDAAVSLATGGLIEYNGHLFEAPYRGMKESEFERWADSISTTSISSMGAVAMYPVDKIVERWKDGTLKPISTEVRGSYALIDTKQNRLLLDKTGKPFLFTYDKARPSVDPTESNIGPGYKEAIEQLMNAGQ